VGGAGEEVGAKRRRKKCEKEMKGKREGDKIDAGILCPLKKEKKRAGGKSPRRGSERELAKKSRKLIKNRTKRRWGKRGRNLRKKGGGFGDLRLYHLEGSKKNERKQGNSLKKNLVKGGVGAGDQKLGQNGSVLRRIGGKDRTGKSSLNKKTGWREG